MSRRWAAAFLAAVLLLALGAFLWSWRIRSTPDEPIRSAQRTAPEKPVPQAAEETREVVLYFPSFQDDLYPEIRTVVHHEDPRAVAFELVSTLLVGPEAGEAIPPLPEGVELAGTYLGGDGILYVDLRSELPSPPSTGSTLERLRVASLVETLLANVPELSGIVLLWNGEQPPTFGGHVDTSRPLRNGAGLVE